MNIKELKINSGLVFKGIRYNKRNLPKKNNQDGDVFYLTRWEALFVYSGGVGWLKLNDDTPKYEDIYYKRFNDGNTIITYHYPSLMCGFGEVHRGEILKGLCIDCCIPYNQAVKEIKRFEEVERFEKE